MGSLISTLIGRKVTEEAQKNIKMFETTSSVVILIGIGYYLSATNQITSLALIMGVIWSVALYLIFSEIIEKDTVSSYQYSEIGLISLEVGIKFIIKAMVSFALFTYAFEILYLIIALIIAGGIIGLFIIKLTEPQHPLD